MLRSLKAVAVLLPALVAVDGQAVEVVRYQGICEASAAAMLDDRRFVVADDNRNDLFVYAIDRPGPDGPPIALDPMLDTEKSKKGPPKKADLEAAARVGSRIYWMGSHSRDSEGKVEKSRWRFFSTPLAEKDGRTTVLPPDRKPYRGLLDDLVADKRLKMIAEAAKKKVGAESKGGLNIEGLAVAPDGSLLIGFRNPLSDEKALVVPFTNPEDVLERGKKASFGKPILLDLGHRGIRSIDRVGDRYLIVAGPTASPGRQRGGDFAIYAWSGDADDAPKRWVNADLRDLGPEALVAIPSSNRVLLLSDDGDDTRACAPGAETFRAITLDLGTARFE